MSAPKLFVRNQHNNTVLNWHQAPEKEFYLYGQAFWNAAKTLLQQNEMLDRAPELHLTHASSFICTVTHSNCS